MSAAEPAASLPGGHVPVMLAKVVEVLRPRDGGIYVDGTFGAGGYSRALLDAADCVVWAIDRDPAAVRHGAELARRYSGRLTIVEGPYGAMDELLADHAVASVDGVALDLGVSSMQIEAADRGFSFRLDGPLDMRMSGSGPSAADAVNDLGEDELAHIIYTYGEERRSRRIAHAIIAARREAPITRTGRLAEIVRTAIGRGGQGIDPATRTFQALRIHVNDELGELDRGLHAAERLLSPGGRLAVVSFHSLEDRAVKTFLAVRSGAAPSGSRHRPERPKPARKPSFRLLFRRVTRPDEQETAANPRARSARLRAAERTAAPAWPSEKAA